MNISNAVNTANSVLAYYTSSRMKEGMTYDLNSINSKNLLGKELHKSPYGYPYTGACVTITSNTDGADTYSICLTDGHFGIDDTEENIIAGTKGTEKTEVKVDNTVTECTCTNN